jgi:Glycosyl transferase 4-like domain
MAALGPPPQSQPRPSFSLGRALATRMDGLPAAVTMLVADDNIDRRVLVQARTLARAGVRMTVIAVPHPGDIDLDAKEFPEVAIVRIDPGLPIRRPLDIGQTRLRDLPVVPDEVYSYYEHFVQAAVQHPAAIFVAHDLPVLASAIAAADFLGATVFYDAHELYPEQHHFGEERIQLYRRAEASLIRYAEQITTVNQSIAEEMSVRYGVATPRVILNTPDTGGRPVPFAKTTLLRGEAFARTQQADPALSRQPFPQPQSRESRPGYGACDRPGYRARADGTGGRQARGTHEDRRGSGAS